jgi:two-component system, response regulator PdtaR
MTRRLRIAVADDERRPREFLRRTLPHLGHEVVCVAESGKELVHQCRASHPDVVITDIKMPDMDGLEAAKALCEQDAIPVIIVSAYHDAQLFERALAENVMAYLVKPIRQADLEAAIAIATGRFEQLQLLKAEAANLRQALEDRKIIEQAKGVLMKKANIDEGEAFRRLRKLANDGSRKMVEVARMILMAGEAFQPAPKGEPNGRVPGRDQS